MNERIRKNAEKLAIDAASTYLNTKNYFPKGFSVESITFKTIRGTDLWMLDIIPNDDEVKSVVMSVKASNHEILLYDFTTFKQKA